MRKKRNRWDCQYVGEVSVLTPTPLPTREKKTKYMEELKERISLVNEFTNQDEVRTIAQKLLWLDANNPENSELLNLARNKNII